MNAVEIAEAVSELVLKPFDENEFPYLFLEAFGNKSTTIKKLRTGSHNKSDCGGVLQRNNIHIATVSSGEIQSKLFSLRNSKATEKFKSKFILVTDGNIIESEDINSGEVLVCSYSELSDRFGFFFPLAGITAEKKITENAFDIKATGRLNKLYVQLLNDNEEWGKSAQKDAMNHFMARLIFCFFAEDTDIFGANLSFSGTVEQMSNPDSSNTHIIIGEIFKSMSLPNNSPVKLKMPKWAARFPYVNGGLFDDQMEVPLFSKISRSYLIHIGSLDWTKINPDIFGSMIQAVADVDERSELGMHYTSIPNILKVLNPLILDDLRNKLLESKDNQRKLFNLRNRISRIRFLDPACGSGNFLVIAYKELRKLEMEINEKRGEFNRESEIPLTNFRGIELRSFSVEIARLSLIITQYQCDVIYLGQREALNMLLPLKEMNWITCGNALEIDWKQVCPPYGFESNSSSNNLFDSIKEKSSVDFQNEGGETYICGNPPYKGKRYQTTLQKEDLKNALGKDFKNFGNLDYISGWFFKASELTKDKRYRCAFVTTSSICEGQQVSILWPKILKNGNRISFAYRPFKWKNLAKSNSAVTVVIIGIDNNLSSEALLYEEDLNGQISKKVPNINAYLVASKNIYISKSNSSLFGLKEMVMGEKLTDGGNLIFSQNEYKNLTQKYPETRQFLRRLIGAQELIKGVIRYVLFIPNEKLDTSIKIPEIESRLKKVTQMRKESSDENTKKIANTPNEFSQTRFQFEKKIVVAQVSSEIRKYYPCDFFSEVDVPMAPSFVIYNPELWNFALISSKLHHVWISTVCGKLETRYRYSNTLGWHTFPLPRLMEKNKIDLSRSSINILLARESNYPLTISELYDPSKMPDNLKAAHDQNDEILERIYIGRRFKNDTERIEKLFDLYTKKLTQDKKNLLLQ